MSTDKHFRSRALSAPAAAQSAVAPPAGAVTAAMRRAIDIARFGPDDTPNPQVGCVLLTPDGRIVAEGWHLGAGTPHAEVAALAALPVEWRGRAGELTAVVTLEPCNHTGRTGPCAHALVAAGIGRVSYAVSDPTPDAAGGAAHLEAHGVAVSAGVEVAAAERLLAPWLARRGSAAGATTGAAADPRATATAPRRAEHAASQHRAKDAAAVTPPAGRPRIILKWAQSLDGRAAADDGSSQWITGPAARRDVHRRRAAADAILVGTGTLLADDPALTARRDDGSLLVPAAEQPVPVVLGSRPIPETARVRRHPALAGRPPIHLTPAPDRSLGDLLASLTQHGITSVFVEGGPTVIAALLAAGLADELLVYTAPTLLGGRGLALGDIGVTTLDRAVQLTVRELVPLGPDVLVRAEIAGNTRPEAPVVSAARVPGTRSQPEPGPASAPGPQAIPAQQPAPHPHPPQPRQPAAPDHTPPAPHPEGDPACLPD